MDLDIDHFIVIRASYSLEALCALELLYVSEWPTMAPAPPHHLILEELHISVSYCTPEKIAT